MKTIVYSKITNLPCGEVVEGDTPQNEILRNAIPNFGGTEKDYDYIKVSELNYMKFSTHEFTIQNGEIVFGNEKVLEESPQEPSEIEKLKEENILLMDATATLYIENLALKDEAARLNSEDLNNKEAIADLYMMSLGGA